MREFANPPLASQIAADLAKDATDATTRDRFLRHKREKQQDYMDQDAAGAPVSALGAQWSDFADKTLNDALRLCWGETKQSLRFIPKDLPENEAVPGLFILGLGKLGGHDLNFSSDVDLVAFYDADLVPVPAFVGRTDITARILRTLNQTLDGSKTGKFVWRIDWRLRPDPSVTDLSMSTEAGEDYHFYRAAPWRRLAMIKARVVAGDRVAGEAFLSSLHPYLWRRHLDFSMIDEIAHLKTRIRREHPDLAEERRVETPLEEAAGFHLKLGRGGIRDIEFFVNAQQLLWAGRHPHLQTTRTMEALKGLAAEGIVEPATAKRMEEAYWFLRGLENRVQYWADGHTHFVPHDGLQQEWLAERSGVSDWAKLAKDLTETRKFVDETVTPLFAQHEERGQTVTIPEIKGEEADAYVAERLAAWASEAPNSATPQAIWQAAQATKDPTQSMRVADSLLRRLGNRGQYLRLMSQDSKLFDAVIPPLFSAPAMASLLDQSAHVVDGLIGRAGVLPAAPELDQGRAMTAAAGSFEGKLEAARAWVNEQLYLVYLSVYTSQRTVQEAERHLTHLAETALKLVSELVVDDLGLSSFPLCILGLGKMGMHAMAPHSDLDLIFVVEEGWSLEDANAVAARFTTAFNAQMREGRVWEIDTRLRPSGRSGPPTITLSSFETHHLSRAKTWEHIAQVPMRPLTGSHSLQSRVMDVKRAVLERPRDLQQLTADAYRMLLRLRDQRIYDRPDEPGEVKLRPGGLMELEYLLAVKTLGSSALLSRDMEVDHDALAALFGKAEPVLEQAADDLRALRNWFFLSRLFGPSWLETQDVKEEVIAETTMRVSRAVRQLIDEPAQAMDQDWIEYQEESVRWV